MKKDQRKYTADQANHNILIIYTLATVRSCACAPEDVLRVQIYMQPVDEQGRFPRLQAQSSFEKLRRRGSERRRNINVTQHLAHIKTRKTAGPAPAEQIAAQPSG